MERKKPGRRAEPGPKRRIAWPRWTGFRRMTVRDWMQLLIVPLALVVIGFLFTAQQDQRQQQIEDQRAQREQEIEAQRAESERELAEQRAQDEALQAYLDQMSSLLLEKDLRNADEGSEAHTLARARTLTVLGRLDSSRKTQVMQFLVEANLVQSVDERDPIISLANTDLSDTDLSALWSDIDLQGADLQSANLGGVTLEYVDLSDAELRFADLHGADLKHSILSDAYLGFADLREADLLSDVLAGADLRYADLGGGASLLDAVLREADLRGAYLGYADLRDANLGGAKLGEADLSNALLTRAEGVTEEELEQAAHSLAGTTMPDGSVHAGRYTTHHAGRHITLGFEPVLSLWLSGGLRLVEPETADKLYFWTGPDEGALIFTSPPNVFDPSNLSQQKDVSAPESADEWVSWFQRHPNLDTSTPVPVYVGGASGMRIDVTASSTPENYPRSVCGEQPCVPLYKYNATDSIISLEEWKDRFVIVDVEGETIVIDVAAPADKFDEFAPKAEKVLNTVEWESV